MSNTHRTEWLRVDDQRDLSSSLPQLLERAGVVAVDTLKFVRPEALRGREVSEEARELTAKARAEYRNRGFGFWDFLFEGLPSATPDTREGILERAIRHNDGPHRQNLSTSEFAANLKSGRYRDLPRRELIALSSRVSGDAELHLPMLDFAIESNAENLPVVLQALQLLGVDGFLYDSGNSYQLIGQSSVTADELRVVLARAQLLAPITDHRWIAHQFISGECSLRVSTEDGGSQYEQVLVASGRRIG